MAKRRVAGFSKKGTTDAITTVAGSLAGYVGANMLSSSLGTTMTGLTKGLVLFGAGLALSMSFKDPIAKSVGLGVAVNGGTVLLGPGGLTAEGIISGIGRRARMRGIGRDGRYITDGIARGRRMYAVRQPNSNFGQTGVIAGVAKKAVSDYDGRMDYDGSNDFR